MVPRRRLTSADVRRELESLEREHGMTSADFYRRVHEGTLPEHPDFVRWVWLCTIARRRELLAPAVGRG